MRFSERIIFFDFLDYILTIFGRIAHLRQALPQDPYIFTR